MVALHLIACVPSTDPPSALTLTPQALSPSVLDRLVRGAVARSSFKKMQADYQQFNKDRKQSHFRKGVVGDWRAHFSPDQSAWFDQLMDDFAPDAPELMERFRRDMS